MDIADFPDFLEQLKSGSESAFSELFSFGQLMHNAVRYRFPGHSEQLAEDATQAAFLAVCRLIVQRKLGPFTSLDDLRRWLCTLAIRRAVDIYRRDSRYTALNDGSEAVFSSLREESADALDEHFELLNEVRTAIAKLPPEQRRVVTERYVNEKSLVEIASELGVSDNTARSHHYRALKQLEIALRCTFLATDEEAEDSTETTDALPIPSKPNPR